MSHSTKRATLSFIFASAALLLIAALFSPSVRETLTQLPQWISASASSSTQRYEIAVVLDYDSGGSFEWRGYMPKRDYDEFETFQRRISTRYVEEARRALARRLGYFDQVYGEDSSKLASTRVVRIVVTDLRTSTERRFAY